MSERYYTAEEANRLLPELRRSLRELQMIRNRFECQYEELGVLQRQGTGPLGDKDPFFKLECELEFMQMEADAIIGQLALQGIQLKDMESGLVDFPARIDGRSVLLCWRLGEERVEYYHGLEDGFRGRLKLTGKERFG